MNRYLKHAFVEAANVVAMNQTRNPGSHAVRLYQRVRIKKEHGKAVVAVGRHLAESTYWVLKRNEPYRKPVLPSKG